MAINPNTNFPAGAVLTAAQQNRFPRGVMAYTSNTTTPATITAETVTLTGSSFTAVANRYYRVTYNEPSITIATTGSYARARLRLTNGSGTVYQASDVIVQTANPESLTLTIVTTLTAGTTNFVATIQSGSANALTLTRGGAAALTALLLVEDIGPA